MCSEKRNSCAKAFGNWSRSKNLKPKKLSGGQFAPPPPPSRLLGLKQLIQFVEHFRFKILPLFRVKTYRDVTVNQCCPSELWLDCCNPFPLSDFPSCSPFLLFCSDCQSVNLPTLCPDTHESVKKFSNIFTAIKGLVEGGWGGGGLAANPPS